MYLTRPKDSNLDRVIYKYRADGTKLEKTYIKYSSIRIIPVITNYLDGFQYENNVLQFVPTAEGYYDFTKKLYIYNYSDHLGNVRVSYYKDPTTSSVEVLEENNYYPFGLKHTGYNNLAGNPKYNYKYNGKELQETGMYDYGARFYMPDIGRWGVVDPLAEKFPSWSPYSYTFNNPIMFIDPTGMAPDWHKDGQGNLVADKGDNAQTLASYLHTTYSDALNVLGNNGYTQNENGVLNLQVGNTVTLPEGYMNIYGGGNIDEVVLKPSESKKENNNTSTPWMESAFSQMGVSEYKGKGKHNSAIIGYHATTGKWKNDEVPWCASFVNWSLTENNISSLNSASAFAYMRFGDKLDKPAYGALAIMKYSHVGFVAGKNADGRIILLGGNQGDAVNLSPNATSQVKGYRYPTGYTPNYTLPKYNLNERSLNRGSSR